MDSKGFFLGLIAAVVLFLLWKKEQGQQVLGMIVPQAPQLPGFSPSTCSDCGVGGGSPSYAAAPAAQPAYPGTDGFVTPGTPPLAGSTGAGSFYDTAGPTPNSGFLVRPAPAQISPVSTMTAPRAYSNVAGSPTTPAGSVPVRAIQRVPSYKQGGFQQRYNISGVPRAAARNLYLN